MGQQGGFSMDMENTVEGRIEDSHLEPVIIYGAGKTGKLAYEFLDGSYKILFFVDKDVSKWGRELKGLRIYPLDCLKEHRDIKLIIAGTCCDEMAMDAMNYGIEHMVYFGIHLNHVMPLGDAVRGGVNRERTIDLGKFLGHGSMVHLRDLTYIPGGSQTLDYAFLRALVERFHLKRYLEIGTYIGESIHNVSDLCDVCYSITVPDDSGYSMKEWCKKCNRPDYSGRLAYGDNIVHYFCDSKKFDFALLKDKPDIYFIDADHSYEGILCDTMNVFLNKNEDAFVVWHDFKDFHGFRAETVRAIKDALEDEFLNVYAVDNNYCGVYIPKKYQEDFPLINFGYSEGRIPLYSYDTSIAVKKIG